MKVTTESGAVYHVNGDKVTGGSKNLKNGRLLSLAVRTGMPMLISTPERGHLNPHFSNPCVMSTPVVKIEPE